VQRRSDLSREGFARGYRRGERIKFRHCLPNLSDESISSLTPTRRRGITKNCASVKRGHSGTPSVNTNGIDSDSEGNLLPPPLLPSDLFSRYAKASERASELMLINHRFDSAGIGLTSLQRILVWSIPLSFLSFLSFAQKTRKRSVRVTNKFNESTLIREVILASRRLGQTRDNSAPLVYEIPCEIELDDSPRISLFLLHAQTSTAEDKDWVSSSLKAFRRSVGRGKEICSRFERQRKVVVDVSKSLTRIIADSRSASHSSRNVARKRAKCPKHLASSYPIRTCKRTKIFRDREEFTPDDKSHTRTTQNYDRPFITRACLLSGCRKRITSR